MDDDLAVLGEQVEHHFRILPGAHGEAELRVVGVGEPVDVIQGQARVGTSPVRSEIEDTASSDGGQLMAVPDQRETRASLVGNGHQRAGGVLVQHPGLGDQQQVTPTQHSIGGRDGELAGPTAIVVPGEAVLAREPRGGVRL